MPFPPRLLVFACGDTVGNASTRERSLPAGVTLPSLVVFAHSEKNSFFFFFFANVKVFFQW